MAKSAYVHSGRVVHSSATRSPGSRPRSIRPRAISETIAPTSANDTSCHVPSRLYLAAGRSPKRSAARAIMSAIVAEPVDSSTAGTVLDSIRFLLVPSGRADSMWAARREGAAARSGCCYPGGGSVGGALLAYVGEEEGLVDPALEDGHAQLHALLDDFATLHAGLSRELGGREVDCHRYEPPVRFATWQEGTASSGRSQPRLLNTS